MNPGAQPGARSRELLLQVIQERGGLHKSELARIAGKGWGNVGYHVHLLHQAGLVDLERHGRLVWVFDKQVPDAERRLIIATRSTATRRLLEAIGLRERVTVRTLSDELALSKRVIRHHLAILQDIGAVRREKARPPEYAPTRPSPKR